MAMLSNPFATEMSSTRKQMSDAMETPQANGNVLIISMLLELWCANERMPCKVKLPSIHQQMKDSLCRSLWIKCACCWLLQACMVLLRRLEASTDTSQRVNLLALLHFPALVITTVRGNTSLAILKYSRFISLKVQTCELSVQEIWPADNKQCSDVQIPSNSWDKKPLKVTRLVHHFGGSCLYRPPTRGRWDPLSGGTEPGTSIEKRSTFLSRI